MLFLKNSLLLIKSVYILFTEYTKYKLNIIDQIETFNNITNRLSNLNILYTKLLQWIINDTIFFNDDIKKNFEKFTDNVEYTESDIDYPSLLEIVNTHDIKLDSLKPFKSGTISIVFKGMLDDDKPVVIKMIKKNIHARLLESIEFFKLLGNVSRYIPYLCQFNLDSLIKYNSNELLLQTNFVKEAENIELFYSNFKNNSNIIIPRVYKDFTNMNNNVIVMDYIKGVSAYSINFDATLPTIELGSYNLYMKDSTNVVKQFISAFDVQDYAIPPFMVAVGNNFDSGGGGVITYSEDGITWTNSPSGAIIFPGSCNSVAYNGSIWIACGANPNDYTGIVGYSSDGITWTKSISGSALVSTNGTTRGSNTAWNGSIWVLFAHKSIIYSSILFKNKFKN
jgi:hypothetical protein